MIGYKTTVYCLKHAEKPSEDKLVYQLYCLREIAVNSDGLNACDGFQESRGPMAIFLAQFSISTITDENEGPINKVRLQIDIREPTHLVACEHV